MKLNFAAAMSGLIGLNSLSALASDAALARDATASGQNFEELSEDGQVGGLSGRYSDFVSGLRLEISQDGFIRSNIVRIDSGLSTPISFQRLIPGQNYNTWTASGSYAWVYNTGLGQVRCDFGARIELAQSFDGTLRVRLTGDETTWLDAFGRCARAGLKTQTFDLAPQ